MSDRVTHADLTDITDEDLVDRLSAIIEQQAHEFDGEASDEWEGEQ